MVKQQQHRRPLPPTRSRGGNYVVDVENLADLVMRRCEECSVDTHLQTAERFLQAMGFNQDIKTRVLNLVRQRLTERCSIRGATAPRK